MQEGRTISKLYQTLLAASAVKSLQSLEKHILEKEKISAYYQKGEKKPQVNVSYTCIK